MQPIVKNILRLYGILLALMLVVACEPEPTVKRSFTINATTEAIGDSDTKTSLVNERRVYWDIYDEISIGSNMTTDPNESPALGYLVNAGTEDFRNYNGVFVAELPEESRYFLGLYPYNKKNRIVAKGGSSKRFSEVSLYLEQEQPRTNDTSFSKDVFPMVAYYGGHWDDAEGSEPFNLDFHAVAGVVRLQFFNSTDDVKMIDRVELNDDDKQLWGRFQVKDSTYANYENLQLVSMDNGDDEKTLILKCDTPLVFKKMVREDSGSLVSFYAVIPTTGNLYTSIQHEITVKVVTTDDKYFEKKLKVGVRRRGITYVQAIGVRNWTTREATPRLVGNGTEARPFKIYSVDDLDTLRAAFARAAASGSAPRINNQLITENTHFQIMRSGLKLTRSNWTSGIKNFKGRMLYNAANVNKPSVINNSDYPLFESIGPGGKVSELIVARNSDTVVSSSQDFSFFCLTNNGIIDHCKFTTTDANEVVSVAKFNNGGNAGEKGIAGICATNNGTISASTCDAKMSSNKGRVAGICLVNTGTIKTSSVGTPFAAVSPVSSAAGICYKNENVGKIENCFFAGRDESVPCDYAGIAFENSGEIKLCLLSNTATLLGNKKVGGIALNNQSGAKINDCEVEATLKGSQVAAMAVNNHGRIINSFTYSDTIVITAASTSGEDIAAGLVCTLYSGGSIENSSVYVYHILADDPSTATTGGLVGVIDAGCDASTAINNCYVCYYASTPTPSLCGDPSVTSSTCYIVGVGGITKENVRSSLESNRYGHEAEYSTWKDIAPPYPDISQIQ